ncbi:hypothetical protein BDZ97DRAFT_1752935 [Flammula alnicola]|nr:hypothetical protein BDZ97DRAFT_1752935 [Flammula alnicola]
MLLGKSTDYDIENVRERVRARKREHYRLNLERECKNARLRAQRAALNLQASARRKEAGYSDEEIFRRKELHRQAQARYREANRSKLRHEAWQYKRRIRHEKLRQRDEEEFQAFMSLDLDMDGK